MWDVIKNRNFTYLWVGQALSRFGDGVYAIALAWMALELTGSPLALGVTLAMSALPALCFGFIVGSLVDRWNRKIVLIACDIIRAAILTVVWALYSLSLLNLGVLMGAEFILAVFTLAYGTARGAVLPRVVPKEQLTAANSLQVTTRYLIDIAGKVGGGAIVVAAGTPIAILIDITSFLVSLLFTILAAIPESSSGAKSTGSAFRDFASFLLYARSRPNIMRMGGYLVAVNIGVPAIIVALPVIAKFHFQSPMMLGALQAAFGLGGMIAGVLAVRLSKHVETTHLAVVCSIGFGAVLLLSGLTSAIVPLGVLITLSGVCGPLVLIYVTSYIQKEVAAEFIGRAMATLTVLLSVIPVIALAGFGGLVEVWGTQSLLGGAGGLVVLATLACAFIGGIVPRARHRENA